MRHDLLVYSDEIYDRLAYGYVHAIGDERPARDARADDPHGRLLEGVRDDRLAGRLLAAPAAILEGIVKVHQYGIMSAPTTAQDAALVALVEGEPEVERMLAEYDRRRRLLVDGLNALRPRDVRAARRLLRLPADRLDRARPTRRSPSAC